MVLIHAGKICRVIQYGGGDGGPPWRPVPPIKKILSLPIQAHGPPPCIKIFSLLRTILSPYVQLFSQMKHILPIFYQIKDK